MSGSIGRSVTCDTADDFDDEKESANDERNRQHDGLGST